MMMLSKGPCIFLHGFFSLPRKARLTNVGDESFRNYPVYTSSLSYLQNEPTPYILKTEVANFSFALCPGTVEINSAFFFFFGRDLLLIFQGLLRRGAA